MNPPVPSESCPAYPVKRLSPRAASAYTRNGIRTAWSQYSLARRGGTTTAAATAAATNTRSWTTGKMAWSPA